MDDSQRLKLQEMVNENNVADKTDLIRKLKHSDQFEKDIQTMLRLKTIYTTPDEVHAECMCECFFLYTNYTDIYNKIRKDEIDVDVLYQFVAILKEIEDGILDQHEASFRVGTILKELYIDSALRKAEKLNENDAEPEMVECEPVSWSEYKMRSKQT
tara:strand:- start:282 stop:752 length:471 start_codon:yes stop_codon:yes gene_type:complete